ncbi:uncharacterized protein LOC111634907 [Centruroides sculpturatus]|uniref:uncharacterized protein LOC111634907 n=1 Tax=Centruroides sculpturatus TaxID=218467 RepID=UPI000C6D19F3|nr:uncharacterized protein LOC111634907 [Centruroides sculpturatus]
MRRDEESVTPTEGQAEQGMVELFTIRDELEQYMEENPNSKFGTKTHSRSILEFFDRMINVYKTTKKPANTEIEAISKKLDQLIEDGKMRHQPVPTYAEKAKGPTPASKTNHKTSVIIVESVDQKEDAETIKKKLKQHLNPKALKVGITKVRKIRNQSILVELEKQGSEGNIIEEICKIEKLTAREPKRILPKIAIYNVPADIGREGIKEAIYQQNMKIAEHYSNQEDYEKDINIKYKWGRRPEVNHWVCEVAPKLKKILSRIKKINIDWVRCSVDDYYNIVQCFRCCKYGHFAKECSSDRAFCNHCGGTRQTTSSTKPTITAAVKEQE